MDPCPMSPTLLPSPIPTTNVVPRPVPTVEFSYLEPADNGDRPERQSYLAKLHMCRFELRPTRDDLDEAIEWQQAAVDLSPAGDPDKPERLSLLGMLYIRRFEHDETPGNFTASDYPDRSDRLSVFGRWLPRETPLIPDELDRAIKNQRAAMGLPADDGPYRLDLWPNLPSIIKEWDCIFFGTGHDLDNAIGNQQAAVDLTPAGDPNGPERLRLLATSLVCRSKLREEPYMLYEAIKDLQAAVDLTPAGDPDKPERLRTLVGLLGRHLATFEPDSEAFPALDILPIPTRGSESLYEIVKDMLFEELRQLGICIKKSKHQDLFTTICRMGNAISCLKMQDGEQLCQDIFKASTRLGAYCQALRNRASDVTTPGELEDLYKEFVRIEREFSAAHDRINSKYEQLYKQWKADRQTISKFLSKADSTKSQSDNQEVRALIERVDAGFEMMGAVLRNEAKHLKSFSETVKPLLHSSMEVHHPPDPPVVSSDPTQIPPQPPDTLSTPSDVSKKVDDVMETLSQVEPLIEKSRYSKARKIISEKSSKTMQRLQKLRISSENYDEGSQSLFCLRTSHNDNSRFIRKRQLGLCDQLSNLVGIMRRNLKKIEKGFDGCKGSIPGLVFRPLGDLLCDLEPYLSQAGFEVSSKGLHPDLILYEAAFRAIADGVPSQSEQLERVIKSSLSVLDKLRGA